MGLCAASAGVSPGGGPGNDHSSSIPGTLEGIRVRIIEQHQALHGAVPLNQVSEAHTHLALIRSLSEASLGKIVAADRPYVYPTVVNIVAFTDELEKAMAAANPAAIQGAHGRLEAALQSLESQLAQARPLLQQSPNYNRTPYRPRYIAPHRSYARPYIVRPRVVHPPRVVQPPAPHRSPAPRPQAPHKSPPPKRRAAAIGINGFLPAVSLTTINPQKI